MRTPARPRETVVDVGCPMPVPAVDTQDRGRFAEPSAARDDDRTAEREGRRFAFRASALPCGSCATTDRLPGAGLPRAHLSQGRRLERCPLEGFATKDHALRLAHRQSRCLRPSRLKISAVPNPNRPRPNAATQPISDPVCGRGFLPTVVVVAGALVVDTGAVAEVVVFGCVVVVASVVEVVEVDTDVDVSGTVVVASVVVVDSTGTVVVTSGAVVVASPVVVVSSGSEVVVGSELDVVT